MGEPAPIYVPPGWVGEALVEAEREPAAGRPVLWTRPRPPNDRLAGRSPGEIVLRGVRAGPGTTGVDRVHSHVNVTRTWLVGLPVHGPERAHAVKILYSVAVTDLPPRHRSTPGHRSTPDLPRSTPMRDSGIRPQRGTIAVPPFKFDEVFALREWYAGDVSLPIRILERRDCFRVTPKTLFDQPR